MDAREKAVAYGVIPVLLAITAWAVFILPADDVPTPAPTPTAASSSPTPTATPPSPSSTPTFTPTERFTPTELPTGEDFQQILQTIEDIRREAFERRDEAVLGQIYMPQCDCSTEDQEAIRDLVSKGLVVEGAVPEVFDVTVSERSDTNAAVVIYRVRFTPGRRVDATTGDVVAESDAFEIRLESALLRGFGDFDDGRWLAATSQRVKEDSE